MNKSVVQVYNTVILQNKNDEIRRILFFRAPKTPPYTNFQ